MKTILPGQVRVGCALNIPLQNFFCLCGLSEGAPKLWLKCQESLGVLHGAETIQGLV